MVRERRVEARLRAVASDDLLDFKEVTNKIPHFESTRL